MTKSQIFFWLLVAFIAGVAVASFISLPLALIAAVFGLGGALAAFGLLGAPGRVRVAVIGFCVLSASAGSFWFLRESRVPETSLDRAVGQEIAITATVDDDPVRRAQTQRLVVRESESAAKVLVVSRAFPEYGYGDRLRISGRLERPENFSPDFDYAAYLAKDDIYLVMRFPEIELLGHNLGSPLYRFLFRMKERFASNLDRVLPEPHAAFMAGLIIGERQSFPKSLTEKLRQTGTSHVVALSGYNITILADALMKALMIFFVPFRLAFWLAVAGIIGFTMLTGAAASVVRAAVMGILVLIARREGRLYRMRNALAFAAVAMLIHNPQILRFDAGFQLSFMATLGLLYGAPIVEQWYETIKLRMIPPVRDAGLIRDSRDPQKLRRRKRSLLKETFIATLAAQFAVLPLLVYQFGTLSLVSPLANLAIIPLIPATMFFGFLTGLVGFVSELAGRIAALPAFALLGYELSAIDFFSRLPLAALEVSGFGVLMLIGGYALIGYVLWRAHRSHNRRQSGRP